MANTTNLTTVGILNLFDGGAGAGQGTQNIALKAFVLNIAVGLGLFAFEISGFFLLKSSALGRRIYQPKTYLVQQRLRVEAVPANPIKWIRRIFSIEDEELKAKCGLDGYFFIRLLRGLIIIFAPLMVIVVTILLPVNHSGGADSNVFLVGGKNTTLDVRGLDTLSWQNIAPSQTNRYWAHLVCAVLAICWTLFRMYREKINFIDVRQRFLTSPEHRLKASSRTVLVTNIPSEYRSKEALETLYDVFVDNDDHSKLTVWINRDYGSLRALVARRRTLRHSLEKEELRVLRMVNKKYTKGEKIAVVKTTPEEISNSPASGDKNEPDNKRDENISNAFEMDCLDESQLWYKYLSPSNESKTTLVWDNDGSWKPASLFKRWISRESKKVPKIPWLRAETARLTVQIEELLLNLDDEAKFQKQNSAFIQFDRQISAHMACSLTSHSKAGRMSPRYLEVAPHEIIWSNMDVTSVGRFVRTCIALVLFLAMLLLWGLPTTFLGPLTSILLALLIQLVVPALSRKLAVLVGTPTRSKREVVTQNFYFTFLFIELVLVTSISSGVISVIPQIVANPVDIPTVLANNLPKAANYFFNYIIIQSLGFSGSVLFQYLRILYITTIWPWFTQTPREEAWLQTTIPHQMWGNVYSLMTNFAVIGLIYCIISPLMLIFVSITFSLLWVAYRHNYYYVQRNKVDTHGLLFNNAISQLFAGVYVLEIALIGLFFLVRDLQNHAVCTPQAIIMIVVLVLTGVFHFILDQNLRPLYEFLPVTLEDPAVDAEKQRFLTQVDDGTSHALSGSRNSESVEPSEQGSPDGIDGIVETPAMNKKLNGQSKSISATAANARRALLRLKKETAARVTNIQAHIPEPMNKSRRREVADQLGAAIAGYPDELSDLSLEEREVELKAAFQDPVTREPAPIIWIPQDPAGISEDTIKQTQKYGHWLQYSNDGAYLTSQNKCEVTQPAPDVKPDWLLEWEL